MIALDADSRGIISTEEINGAVIVLKKIDKNKDGNLTKDELRPSFFDNRSGENHRGIIALPRMPVIQIEKPGTQSKDGKDEFNLERLWSYGLTSRRAGKPLIEKGGERQNGFE